ncbi:MAG TPA: hypothetical protein PLP19_11095 [bacterium]|nr:hypothetical protein [bacterium]HPN44027.1 hypothetical protein [bacterium]
MNNNEQTKDINIQLVEKHDSTQQKFEFFFLSIILGSLALSIQTWNLTEENNSLYLIILTWISLGISLITALFRIEKILQIRQIDVLNLKEQINLNEIEKMIIEKLNNNTIKSQDLEIKAKGLFDKHKKQSDEANKFRNNYKEIYSFHFLIAYKIQKWTFLFSILTFGLFKTTNILNLSFCSEILIIFSVILIVIFLVLLYEHILNRAIKKKI